ncbi:MAG: aminotransferase class III-fold pyridoxal phosphate-dependent enzyme [Candidatus Moranbacteria bacterium]|nr:aminotransferase class III-fold pyridoxal phosphate-dependent enzyme [Candidatus Moranbacteria bacterium]
MKNYSAIQKQYLIPVYPNRGLTITRGEGSWLYDTSNKKYLDCMGGYGVNLLGHQNQEIVSPIKKQLYRLISLHSSLNNDTRSLAIQKLVSKLPNLLNQIYFSSSGTESVEAAIKFAYLITERTKFIAAKNGYHGKTLGALAATNSNKGKYQNPFSVLINQFDFLDFGDLAHLKKLASKKHAAVILEPIQGEGGVIPAPPGYLAQVKKICQKHGILLIIDEIQTGLGRTGQLFAFQNHNVTPDILCLGKGLGGEIPCAATIIQKKYRSFIPRGIHTSTFGGNPLASSGLLAVLNYIDKYQILKQVQANGRYFLKQLKSIPDPIIRSVRGQGLMIALEIKRNNMRYVKKLQDLGVLTIPTSNTIIRFLPPLIINKKEIDYAVKQVKKCLAQ